MAKGRSPLVLVLGCGPAGLLAAHAAYVRGFEIKILSRKEKSSISGAQYIHQRIPYLKESQDLSIGAGEFDIEYIKLGTAEMYAERVYGNRSAPVSFDRYSGRVAAWSMRRVYDQLWDLYNQYIEPTKLDWSSLENLWKHEANAVVSSVPLKVFCSDPQAWEWKSQNVFVEEYAEPSGPAMSSYILYNGLPWEDYETGGNLNPFRVSGIEGITCGEYTDIKPGRQMIVKPISTNWVLPSIMGVDLLVGRYGKWDKNVLAHQAYGDTVEMLTRKFT